MRIRMQWFFGLFCLALMLSIALPSRSVSASSSGSPVVGDGIKYDYDFYAQTVYPDPDNDRFKTTVKHIVLNGDGDVELLSCVGIWRISNFNNTGKTLIQYIDTPIVLGSSSFTGKFYIFDLFNVYTAPFNYSNLDACIASLYRGGTWDLKGDLQDLDPHGYSSVLPVTVSNIASFNISTGIYSDDLSDISLKPFGEHYLVKDFGTYTYDSQNWIWNTHYNQWVAQIRNAFQEEYRLNGFIDYSKYSEYPDDGNPKGDYLGYKGFTLNGLSASVLSSTKYSVKWTGTSLKSDKSFFSEAKVRAFVQIAGNKDKGIEPVELTLGTGDLFANSITFDVQDAITKGNAVGVQRSSLGILSGQCAWDGKVYLSPSVTYDGIEVFGSLVVFDATTNKVSTLQGQVSAPPLPSYEPSHGGVDLDSEGIFDSNMPTPRINLQKDYETGYVLSFDNAKNDYYFEAQLRWYSVDDISIFRDGLLWKYSYKTVLKGALEDVFEASNQFKAIGEYDLMDYCRVSFDNFLKKYPIDSRHFGGDESELGYSDALYTLKDVLLRSPSSLYNGLELYVRYFRYDNSGNVYYSKWSHFYNNMADPVGSTGSRLDDESNMDRQNQSKNGLTGKEKDSLEDSGFSKNDSDIQKDTSYSNSSFDWSMDSFKDLLSDSSALLGQFPQLVSDIFGFLPAWLISLVAIGVGLLLILRFLGR